MGIDLNSYNYLEELIVVFAVLFIAREALTLKNNIAMKYILTPLVTVSVIAVVILSFHYNGITKYSLLIFSSLIVALIADTILMIIEVDLLKHGIIFFFAGHILYIAAFLIGYSFDWRHLIVAALLAGPVYIALKNLRGRKNGYDLPVTLYIFAIALMVFFAVIKGITMGGNSLFALYGAILFMFSDIILSINAFIRPVKNSTVYTWLLYGPAQLLIALSCF